MGRPDLSGVWIFNRARSSLQITPPDTATFVIRHCEPHFHLERTHVVGKKSDSFTIDLVTDGGSVELIHGGVTIRARLYWEGEDLTVYSELRREDLNGTNIVRYRLESDRETLTAFELLSVGENNHENNWVFDRQ